MSEQPIDDWISAYDALLMLEPKFGGAVSAKAEIADRLRDGRLSARAKRIWRSNRRLEINQLWRDGPGIKFEVESIEQDVDVDPWEWRYSLSWPDDQSTWRWNSGRFALTHAFRPMSRAMVDGIEFRKVEITAIRQLKFDLVKEKGAGGRTRDEAAWTAALHAILDLERSGRLQKGSFVSQQDLRLEIEERIGDSLKARSLVYDVRQLWKKYVDINRPPS